MNFKNGFFCGAACVFAALAASASLERDMEFLLENAPPQDLPLPGDYVTNNCVLAAIARENAIEQYPDDIYLEYVLPYSVIREGCDDWRAEFRERFLPVIEGCKDSYDAAVKLDRTIWDMINVHYDKRRDQARQSPRHSMRIGMASCTGISIILIDACRALGIPARLVGCRWSTILGNHSWVEVWSGGRWRVLASGEKEREDDIWFLEYAAQADVTRPDRRIYASRASLPPALTRFWLTWDNPGCVSDVPADDITWRYVRKPRFAVVASPQTLRDSEWRGVVDALAAKHAEDAAVEIIEANPVDALANLRASRPRFVAFVMRPGEFANDTIVALKQMMRQIDSDPFDDAVWGIVTGPDAATALRIASSCEPRRVSSILATTGVDDHLVNGPVAVISDAYPKGEWRYKDAEGNIERHSSTGSLYRVFVDAWRAVDPEFLLTSSHATERNLEMPFSLGNIIVRDGAFAATPEVNWAGAALPLAAPQREKVWLAAGNCLIANHLDTADMVMTALSFGKVNQFVGYIKPTWFGFAGWKSWHYFGTMGYSLTVSHYAACQWLNFKLASRDVADEKEMAGLLWDRDATVFYGDPMQFVHIKDPVELYDAAASDVPSIVIFSESSDKPRIKDAPQGFKVFEADDFALFFQQK